MSEMLRVLQVEDSESDAALVVRLLEKAGYIIQSELVEEAESMRRALARQEWDVILADHQLPRFDACGALKVLQECGQDIPFIIVSGTISQDRAAEMMRAGAHDYILKDRIARLAPVIQREMRDAQFRRERRQMVERLRDRDEWLALVVGVTRLGMFDYYPHSGKFVLSEESKLHFGLPAHTDASYETYLRGVHPDDRERVDDLLRKAFAGENGGEYTADYRTIGITDGIERWLDARGKVFFDSAGEPVRFVGVTIDITERKQLEEQFRQSQKLEGLGRLAGGVAHDFNNLLTVITGFTQMTLDELPLLHPLRDGVEEVVKAAALATNLTRQLLAFSRQQPSRTEIIVLNTLVAGVQKMLVRMIDADVNLTLCLDPAAGAIRADAGQIEQVIMNLVVNSRDAMPNGGKLVIGTALRFVDESLADSRLGLAPGRYAALSVSDTGAGIPPEVKARMFDPFFTTKRLGKGTGLGLSTVYGIVKECGGSISVDSEPGRGATFTMLFPAVEAQFAEVAVPLTASTPSATETILLADDDAGVRRFVRMTLEQRGYRVLECSNGREAIERARQHLGPIHLLITDAVMPEMGGAELERQFVECRPGVPVLCIFGYSAMVWPGAAVEGGCLQKPFTPAVLLAKVRALLDRTAQPIPV